MQSFAKVATTTTPATEEKEYGKAEYRHRIANTWWSASEQALQPPSTVFFAWFLGTFFIGAGVALLTVSVWTGLTIDYGLGIDVHREVKANQDVIYLIVLAGFVILFVLFLLDFFTAPHLISKYEDAKLDVDVHSHEPYVHHHFVMGQKAVSPLWTAVGRVLFVLALLCIAAVSCTMVDDHPSLPMLTTLILFPVCQYLLYACLSKSFLHHEVPTIAALATSFTSTLSEYPDKTKYIMDNLNSVGKHNALVAKAQRIYYVAGTASTAIITCFLLITRVVFLGDREDVFDEAKEALDKDKATAWTISRGFGLVIVSFALFTITYGLLIVLHDGVHGAPGSQASILPKEVREQRAVKAVKLSFLGIMVVMLGFWIGVQVAGASPGASSAVKIFLAGFLILFGGFFMRTVIHLYTHFRHLIFKNRYVHMMESVLRSDWSKATCLLFCPIALPLFLCMSWLNERVRILRGIDDKRHFPHEDEFIAEHFETAKAGYVEAETKRKKQATDDGGTEMESGGASAIQTIEGGVSAAGSSIPKRIAKRGERKVTRGADALMYKIWRWDLTSIVNKAYWMGIILFIVQVAAERGLFVTLIFLGEAFDSMVLNQAGKVVLIMFLWYLVALAGFMLPPVPGPPLYLFGGVVICRAFSQLDVDEGDFNYDMYYASIAITMIACSMLKLQACYIQQCWIGESLGNRKWMQALVGVHTPTIRATKDILAIPGLSLGKVAILCGGPDWPTSVLCGILRLELQPVLLGTAPCIFFIVPMVLTGAFFIHPDAGYSAMGRLLFVAAVVICSCFGLAAGVVIQNALSKHSLLYSIPLDRYTELDWLTLVENEQNKVFLRECEFRSLPLHLKLIMCVGILAMSASITIFSWFTDDCFGAFDLQTPSKDLAGKFKDLSYYGFGLFVLAFICFKVYRRTLRAKAVVKMNECAERLNDKATGEYDKWLQARALRQKTMADELAEQCPEDYERYVKLQEEASLDLTLQTPVE